MKTRVALIVVPLVLLALALTWGFVLMWHLFFFSILMLLLSYLWARLGIHGIAGEVKKSAEHCQVGEWFGEEVTVFNRSKMPKILVTVQENTYMPGHPNVAAFSLSPNSTYRWQGKVHCQHRGRYNIGSFTATASDPFGLFSFHRTFGEPWSVLVYPATLDLPLFQPLSSNQLGYGPSRWLSNELGTDAAHVREYTIGDNLKRIHWPSTAHTGKLMVKEFDAERSNYASKDIWIIPDMHQASQLGDGDETTEECCITIAASLAKKYINSGDQIGLIASGDQPYLFQLKRGEPRLLEMLEALALMKAAGEVPIDQLISGEIERFGASSAIIVITPSTDGQTFASLRRLKERGATVVVIFLDPVSFGGTVSAVRAARSLISIGVQVYIIRRGEDLTRALDSQAVVPYLRYIMP